jgi:hypothetical protein
MKRAGKASKKVVFYESDKRYADFRIQLENDGLSQSLFFRSLMQAYINGDKNIVLLVDKIINKETERPKAWKAESKMRKDLAEEKIRNLSLDENDIQSIFDILEHENPNFKSN